MLAAGSTKSQRCSRSNVEEEHNAPFQSSKPFFSSSEKPPLYSFSLFPYFSRLLYTAKSSRACFLSWEDGNQTEGRHGMRRGGGGDRLQDSQRWISGDRSKVNCSVMIWLQQVRERKQEGDVPSCLYQVSRVLGYKSKVKCAKQSSKVMWSVHM